MIEKIYVASGSHHHEITLKAWISLFHSLHVWSLTPPIEAELTKSRVSFGSLPDMFFSKKVTKLSQAAAPLMS